MYEIRRGVYLNVDEKVIPCTKMQIKDCMRATSASATTEKLLKGIGAARPSVTLGNGYPKGANVVVEMADNRLIPL